MGTRADFYIRKESPEQKQTIMEWLGSVAYDGFPDGFISQAGVMAMTAKTEAEFRAAVGEVLASRRDGTTPDMGWPWPWDDSLLTDYAYVFDGENVNGFNFGTAFDLQKYIAESRTETEEEDYENKVSGYFPDMSQQKNVAHGSRSGLLVFSFPK